MRNVEFNIIILLLSLLFFFWRVRRIATSDN